MVVIFVQIAINLVPGLNTTLETITTPTYTAGVAGMFGVVLIIYAAMVLWALVKAFEI